MPRTGTAPRHACLRSGNGGTVMHSGRIVRQLAIAVGHPDGLWRRWLCHCDVQRGNRGDAHQTTALSVHHVRCLCRTGVAFHRRGFHDVIDGRIGLHLDAGMVMGMPVLVNVHRALIVHVHHARDVTFAGQAISGGPAARQRKGQCRREHAKQIDQGNQPPCSPP